MDAKDKIAVLLVDDDDDVLNALGKVIEKAGWKCFRAPTGEIALDSFKINRVDTVILDINLPRMNGFDVLKQMRETKPDVPIVMLTGLGYEKEQVDKALKLGASGYIGKTMPVNSVIAKIKSVLSQRQ